MSKRQILEYLLESNTTVSIPQVCWCLLMAVVLGGILYAVYRVTYRGTVYSKSFNLTLLLVTVITAMVMVIIGSNLALSLGMVGSLSIIRFRTAVKEPRDIAFLFWAIAAGLACGSEMYLVGLLGSAVIAVIVLVSTLDVYESASYLLVVRGQGLDAAALQAACKPHAKALKLRLHNTDAGGEEYTWELRLKGDGQGALTAAVRAVAGVESVSLVAYSGEILG